MGIGKLISCEEKFVYLIWLFCWKYYINEMFVFVFEKLRRFRGFKGILLNVVFKVFEYLFGY